MPKASVHPNGPYLLRIRADKGFTQDEVAIKSGYAKRTIERLEAGRPTTFSTLSIVARALEVPVGNLIAEPPERPAHLSAWIDDKIGAELLKDVHISDLICSSESGDAVRLTCCTSKGEETYHLRRNTTAAELCAALRNDLFPGIDGYECLGLRAGDVTFDASHTIVDIATRSQGIVTLVRFVGVPASLGAFWPVLGPEDAVAIAMKGPSKTHIIACYLYAWLLDRRVFRMPIVSTVVGVALGTGFRFVLIDLRYLGWLYAETNTNIQMATRIARVIELTPDRYLGNVYYDVLSWIAYRTGNYAKALRWALRTPDSDWRIDLEEIRAYHLYFLLGKLRSDPEAQQLIRACFDPPVA